MLSLQLNIAQPARAILNPFNFPSSYSTMHVFIALVMHVKQIKLPKP